MKKIQLVKISIAVLTLLLLISCATTQTSIQASKMGFTKELDEPSARGQLTRISPEQSNVKYRFCLSPDNKNIIFSGIQSGGSDNLIQLWKISSSGLGSPIKITSGGSNHKLSPSFTNDGEYIVYSSEGQLWKVRKDGAGGKMKIPGSGTNQDFSPNVSINNILVFCSVQQTQKIGNNKYLIWTSNLNGGELTQIREGIYPRWSPDGTKIVFEHKNEIWVINAEGTNLMQLTNTSDLIEGLPSFSPDGKKLVYTSNEGSNGKPIIDYNIWTMNVDGSEKKQETELSSWDSWPIWGKDGIYFLSARAQKKNEQNQRIWKLVIK
ncbi:MAG: DPP IV N-terminal domain-containing protein [Candidatus Cloacimonetes bacterium]|nr:DPP IV N-terminal domain-containing protein [Candidatus Cloacimonadota bacterium]